MNTKPYMSCGHAANTQVGGIPACAICYPAPQSMTVIDPPDLAGRMASCAYCPSIRPSDLSLPFFEYRPEHRTDSFYCLCRGCD